MSVIEKYHDFLRRNNIENFLDLSYVITEEPYYITFVESKNHEDLIMAIYTEFSDIDNEVTKIFSNLIINIHNIRDIVCYTGPIYRMINNQNINTYFNYKLDNYTFYKAYDGVCVELFNYNNKWIVSFDNLIDSSEEVIDELIPITAKSLFIDLCNSINFDYTKLDKNYVYTFGLYHEKARNVVKHNINTIIHLETFDKRTFLQVDKNIGIQQLQTVEFNNLHELRSIINNISWNYAGFVAENIKTKEKFRIIPEHFMRVYILRNLDKNPIKRYLILKQENSLEEYHKYFPEDMIYHKDIEKEIIKYARYFYKNYVNIKIRKKKKVGKYIPYEKDIIEKIHQVYIETKKKYNIRSCKSNVKIL